MSQCVGGHGWWVHLQVGHLSNESHSCHHSVTCTAWLKCVTHAQELTLRLLKCEQQPVLGLHMLHTLEPPSFKPPLAHSHTAIQPGSTCLPGLPWLPRVRVQDISHLLSISYQFSLRWTNNAIMLMSARSPLTKRLMRLAAEMPANHPHFARDVIRRRCRPYGYRPVSG